VADEEKPEQDEDEDEEAFVRGLIERGEAAKPDEHGNLPPGATHEIVEDEEGKPPKVKRRRFTSF
jgi:hypothetical protein